MVLARVIVVLPRFPIKLFGSKVVLAGLPVKLAGSAVVELAAAWSAMLDFQLAKVEEGQTSFLVPFRLYTPDKGLLCLILN